MNDIGLILGLTAIVAATIFLVIWLWNSIDKRGEKRFKNMIEGFKALRNKAFLDDGASNLTIHEIVNQNFGIKYPVVEEKGIHIEGFLPLELVMAQMQSFCNKVEIIYSTNISADVDRPGAMMYNEMAEGYTIHVIRADKAEGTLYFVVQTCMERAEWVAENYELSSNALKLYQDKGEICRVTKVIYLKSSYAEAKARQLEKLTRNAFPARKREYKPEAMLARMYKTPFGVDYSSYSIEEVPKSEINLDYLYGTLNIKSQQTTFDLPASAFIEVYLDQAMNAYDHVNKEGKEIKAANEKINIHINGPVGTGKTRLVGDIIHSIYERNEEATVFSTNALELGKMLGDSQSLVNKLAFVKNSSQAPIFLIVDESDRFFDTKSKTEEQSVLLEIMDGSLTFRAPVNVIVISNLKKMGDYFERRFDMNIYLGETPAERINRICREVRGKEFVDEEQLAMTLNKNISLPLSQVFNDIIIPPRILALRKRQKKIQALLQKMETKSKPDKAPETNKKGEDKGEQAPKKSRRSRRRQSKR